MVVCPKASLCHRIAVLKATTWYDHDMNPALRITKLTTILYRQSSLQQIETRDVTKTLLIDR